jgi:hypothetical protein
MTAVQLLPWLLPLFVTIILALVGWMWGMKHRAVAAAYKNGLGKVEHHQLAIAELKEGSARIEVTLDGLAESNKRVEMSIRDLLTQLLSHLGGHET